MRDTARKVIPALLILGTIALIGSAIFEYVWLKKNGAYAVGRTTSVFTGAYSQRKIRYEYFVDKNRFEGVIGYRSEIIVPEGYYLVIYSKGMPSVSALAYSYPLNEEQIEKDWSLESVDPSLVNFWNF